MPRRYIFVLILTVLVGAGALGLGSWWQATTSRAVVTAPNVKSFSLLDQAGTAVDDVGFRGRWLLVFFGFTRCPDICPASMIYASDLLQSLGPLADNLTVAFVSVDPERDTSQVLKDYLANFDPRIVGLTGSPEQIAAVTKTFGVYYAPRKIEGQEDYAMDHSTAFYLVGPDGGFRRAYNLQRGADEMTTSLREAMLPKE
jgi:protein SCO1/2